MKITSIGKTNPIQQKNTFVSYAENKGENCASEKSTDISNICYKPLSFGRTWAEHKSWGAVIDPQTKEASFKILTYPDTKKVTVTVQKGNNPKSQKTYELRNQGNGVFATDKKIPAGEVENGDKYSYTIYKGNGWVDTVKDPYSFRQESLLGNSTIYDHSLYQWNDDNWFQNNKDRISRRANSQNGLTSVNEARIYELNTASFTKKGTFDAVKSKLKALKDMGFNAIELMPAENTFSFNWGYDGVDKFAPAEYLGGPDKLKDLINHAHNIGLNVIMDMVPNHIGPDGAALKKTGPYVSGQNAFGEAWNFEGKDSRYVRDFIVNAALNWIDNYHCDGLRLDMTKFMNSDYTMKQIAAEVNYHKPDAFLIAEDSRAQISVNEQGEYFVNSDEPHDKRVINPLEQFESAEGEGEQIHCDAIDRISDFDTSLGRLGYDSEWDFNYFHSLKDQLYGSIDLDRFEKACYCSQDRVKYVMSHDEIGNFEGSRLIAKLMTPMLHLKDNIELNGEDRARAQELSKLKNLSLEAAQNRVKDQKAQFAGEKLAILLLTGELDKYNTSGISAKRQIHTINESFKNQVLRPLGIKASSGITYENIQTMFDKSFNTNKMALARTFAIPGPKMVFQGDERADLTPFRFFRQFQSIKNEDYLYYEKGYTTNKSALEESTLGSILYSTAGKNRMIKFRNLTRDLNLLNDQNPALSNGILIPENTIKHQVSQVFATHAKEYETNNEIFTVTNFNDSAYPRHDATDYYIKFPKGEWKEILNTDSKKYAGTGSFINTGIISSDGKNNSPIKLAGQSTIIFKKVG